MHAPVPALVHNCPCLMRCVHFPTLSNAHPAWHVSCHLQCAALQTLDLELCDPDLVLQRAGQDDSAVAAKGRSGATRRSKPCSALLLLGSQLPFDFSLLNNHHLTASPLGFSHRLWNIAMFWAQVDLISRLLNNHEQSLISNQKRAELVIKASEFDNGGFICHEHKYNQHISGDWMKVDWDKVKSQSAESL